MIDSLVRLLPATEQHKINGLPKRYALVTLHRPSNVDDPQSLKGILESLLEISEDLDIVFPVHPRTCQRIGEFGIDVTRLHLLEPLPYIEFLALGTNVLVGQDAGTLKTEFRKVLDGKAKSGSIPPLWDGKAGERIAHILKPS
jgi:UDP-N-acetylglucosamine 2-epimerase (non-hydrolysing)